MLGGFVADGYEAVAKAFARNLAELGEGGAEFSAYVDGQLVVDVWAGLADPGRNAAWTKETLVGVFSGTKGITATCLLLLMERGLLDLDAPVSRYWPEFAAQGKGSVLVSELVSHRARVPGLLTPVSTEEATDDVRMAALLASQPMVDHPRDSPIYHAITFGWLCGELVRRIDGRSIGRFLREDVAGPLELDLWIGLPSAHEARVAILEMDGSFLTVLDGDDYRNAADPVAASVWSNPPRFTSHGLAANERHWRRAEIPATNGIVAVRSMARLYGCLARGGSIGDVRLVSQETIDIARRPLARGRDPFLDQELTYGTGFALQPPTEDYGPSPDAFGHAGAGGSIHGAWPALKTGFSYAPNKLRSLTGPDPRATALLNALDVCVRGKHELQRANRSAHGTDAPAFRQSAWEGR